MSAQRARFRIALAALVALGLTALGCDVPTFRVQIPGFVTDAVEGIWVYRRSPKTGRYQRFAQIQFTERLTSGSNEIQRFVVSSSQGSLTLQSRIQWTSGRRDDARLDLAFVKVATTPAQFKFTSYNAAGESSLSAGTLVE